MADLRGLLGNAGYDEIKTLGQSGNVVLSAQQANPERLGGELENQIAAGLEVQAKVVVRTCAELAAVVAYNPLAEIAREPKLYQVSFLSAKPDPKAIKAIKDIDTFPEQWTTKGREIYAWHPKGIHDSPLAKLLSDKRLGVAVTARNWNTVTKLLELAQS